uniref:Uncharacterized protein n=1 Tax=Ciona intestinalis TaxID=7719 RepID=H2XK58_CIOIN
MVVSSFVVEYIKDGTHVHFFILKFNCSYYDSYRLLQKWFV